LHEDGGMAAAAILALRFLRGQPPRSACRAMGGPQGAEVSENDMIGTVSRPFVRV
jgi:hypothetical protein